MKPCGTCKYVAALIVLGLVIYLYASYNPAEHEAFPKCPFRTLTGYKCPGCGSQRAIHELLHANIAAAFQQNMLLLISIPYLLTGFIFDLHKHKSPRMLIWRKRLYGKKAIYLIIAIIIAYWILRNTPLFN